MTRGLVAALAVGLLASGCSEPARRPAAEPSAKPARSPEPVQQRGLTQPERVIVDNQATGRYKQILNRARRDITRVRLWQKLTKDLFVVEISARAGERFIPEDGHLADAFRTLDIRDEHAGVLCDITFYPGAMTADLDRWTRGYQSGATSLVPPTMRQLWAAVLAHELSHCLPEHNNERHAAEWEDRALEALREAGIY